MKSSYNFIYLLAKKAYIHLNFFVFRHYEVSSHRSTRATLVVHCEIYSRIFYFCRVHYLKIAFDDLYMLKFNFKSIFGLSSISVIKFEEFISISVMFIISRIFYFYEFQQNSMLIKRMLISLLHYKRMLLLL